jgi:hypothetical protein
VSHDVADRRHRFLTGGAALISGQVYLDVGRLGVLTLGARGGNPLTPEILHMLNVRGVLFQSFD